MIDTLETLCCLDGVSGSEDEVRDYILERCMPFADEIITDNMGNLLILKKGKSSAMQTIMLAAHMDEVGLIITDITEDGFLKFDYVGGIDRRVLMARHVYIGAQKVPGVIGSKPFHLMKSEERDKMPERNELYIDVGAGSKDDVTKLISLGDYVTFADSIVHFGDGFLKAKAIDDRVGCATMIKLLESELPCDCWFAFTVQEELGCRGAMVAARRLCPEVAIVLEGTTSADKPGASAEKAVCSPGKGIVIPFMDGGTMYDRELYKTLTEIADKNHIPWQTKHRIAGGTDASVIQRNAGGTRVAAISVAVRNLHSPACICKIEECELQRKLALAFLENFAC